MPFVFVSRPRGLARLHGAWPQEISQPWAWSFIITTPGKPGIVRSRLVIQAIFQVPEIRARNLADAPPPG
jgi:hypothetical protein